MSFLEAYVKMMSSIAIWQFMAIYLFKGEKECFLGHVIPMILGMKSKLKNICKVRCKIILLVTV